MTTTERLLAVLSLLQSPRAWPGAVLAERLGVTERTVRRDVDRLRQMGYVIRASMGPDGGYRLDAGNELPPLLFDDDQVLALAVGLQAAAGVRAGVGEAAVRALATLRRLMPSRVRHRLDALRFTALEGRPGDAAVPAADPDVLVALSSAVSASEVLRFDYGSGEGPARRVEPHHLVSTAGRWYLVAWDLDRGDWRVFRADRIVPRMPTRLRFRPRRLPGGDVAAFLEARFRGADAGGGWPCEGSVVLDLPAREVLPFAGDGVVADLGDGRCRLRAGAWSWPALAASLGRFDADFTVDGPAELAEACARLGRRFAASVP